MHLTHKIVLATLLSGGLACKTLAQGSRPAPTGMISGDTISRSGVRYPQYQPKPTGRIEQPVGRPAATPGNRLQPGLVPNAYTAQDAAGNPERQTQQNTLPAQRTIPAGAAGGAAIPETQSRTVIQSEAREATSVTSGSNHPAAPRQPAGLRSGTGAVQQSSGTKVP